MNSFSINIYSEISQSELGIKLIEIPEPDLYAIEISSLFLSKKINYMIQRIQTVFMALASLSAILLFFSPVAWYYGEAHTLAFFIHQVKEFMPGAETVSSFAFVLPLVLLNFLLVILPVVSIVRFKKLSLQYSLMRLNMFVSIIMVAALLLFYTARIAKMAQAEANYEFGAFMPLLAMVFSVIAMRGIRADIRLLRSVDRIR
ncbi:MAG: DUF4293 domain-containing protein [Bacteroidales bacterium]|nr:DUF4293 domain-containing protein [Bacteroidales bacterium]